MNMSGNWSSTMEIFLIMLYCLRVVFGGFYRYPCCQLWSRGSEESYESEEEDADTRAPRDNRHSYRVWREKDAVAERLAVGRCMKSLSGLKCMMGRCIMSKSRIDSSQALLFRICGQTCSFLDFMRPCVSMNHCLAARKLMQGALFSVFFWQYFFGEKKKKRQASKKHCFDDAKWETCPSWESKNTIATSKTRQDQTEDEMSSSCNPKARRVLSGIFMATHVVEVSCVERSFLVSWKSHTFFVLGGQNIQTLRKRVAWHPPFRNVKVRRRVRDMSCCGVWCLLSTCLTLEKRKQGTG